MKLGEKEAREARSKQEKTEKKQRKGETLEECRMFCRQNDFDGRAAALRATLASGGENFHDTDPSKE